MAVQILVSVVVHGVFDEADEFGEGDEVIRLVDCVVEHAQVAKEVLQRWIKDGMKMEVKDEREG